MVKRGTGSWRGKEKSGEMGMGRQKRRERDGRGRETDVESKKRESVSDRQR